MAMKIRTPDGYERTVPEWSKCYCVTRHTPMYIHPYPYAFPDGREIWLCPNTFHQANTLWKIYNQLGGPPTGMTIIQYTSFVRQLIKLSWEQKMLQVAVVDKKHQEDLEAAREALDLFEKTKQVLLNDTK